MTKENIKMTKEDIKMTKEDIKMHNKKRKHSLIIELQPRIKMDAQRMYLPLLISNILVVISF
jgi:hypothetical protein